MQTFVLHLSHQTETPFFCADLQITEGAWEISFTTNRKEFSNSKKKLIGISCLADCMPDTRTERGAMRSHTMSSGPIHPRNLQTP
jgi:hypothetical protein